MAKNFNPLPRPPYTDDDYRTFLMQWILHFGTEPTDAWRDTECWYFRQTIGIQRLVDKGFMHPDFTDPGCRTYGVTQAGFDFVKGDSDAQQ